MELLQLKYFQTVARLEHMTKAAAELRIPQPALSKMISALEKDLDVKLFDRTGKYIRLNAYGKAFLRKVDTAIAALEDGKREIRDMSGETGGSIELAVLVGSHLLPDLLASFRQKYPQIGFHLLQHASFAAMRSDFDLCLSSSPAPIPGVESTALLTEEIFLAVPCGHRLAGRGKIRLSEAAGEGFVSLRPGKNLRETADALCRQAGFAPRIIFESDDPATVRGLIRAGQGVGFIPSVTWGGATGPAVELLRIEEPRCERTIWLSWSKDKYLTEAAARFREFTADYFRQMARPAGRLHK